MTWTEHARRLADTLAADGDLHSPQWHAAVAATPRHLLVPRAWAQDPGGTWTAFGTAADLERVYGPHTLVTALDGDALPVSSSTKPDLMVRMLEILDVRDGHRVLEIGTGTGYHAALLAHRLGDRNVFSVDVDPELVDTARTRLAALGHHPTLVAADGAAGLPGHAPYDRIVATCSVPRVPWAWAEQLAPGGALLTDLKLAVNAGNLVLLRRDGDRLQGRFTRRWAAFMAMRPPGPARPRPAGPTEPTGAGGTTRVTTAPAAPWSSAPVVWFLAQLMLPPGITFGYDLDPATGHPVTARLAAPDGSWARAPLGGGTVTEAGDTAVWVAVEWAHEQWAGAGRPAWDRLGLTVRPDGRHLLWLDSPDGRSWTLPAAAP